MASRKSSRKSSSRKKSAITSRKSSTGHSRKSKSRKPSSRSNSRRNMSSGRPGSVPGLKKYEMVTTKIPLTELQHRARSLGIPFGGLSKSKLVKKINGYRWS